MDTWVEQSRTTDRHVAAKYEVGNPEPLSKRPASEYPQFFRYDSASKIIVYAWVNDEKNKRAYGGKTDAYRVFKK